MVKLIFAHAINNFLSRFGSPPIIACGEEGKFMIIGLPVIFAVTMAGNSKFAPIGNIQRLTFLERRYPI